MSDASTFERVRALNDDFRASLAGGRVLLSASVDALPAERKAQVLAIVRTFSGFTKDNDPYGEHDFGQFDVDGTLYCFKVDYYDLDFQHGSEDPSDQEKTARVITIMRADDY